MKKIIFSSLIIITIIIIVISYSRPMPEYSPERNYIDLEEEILEAFILAKDSSTIQLPEGHFLF